MRIESVRAVPVLGVLSRPQRTGVATFTKIGCVLVEVRSDMGIVGYGECLARYSPRIWAAIVDDLLAPLIVGADPFNTEQLWGRMFRDLRSLSGHEGGMLLEAIAGVDMALWDLKGKALGVPVYILLGGATRTAIAAYASSIMQQEISEMEADAAALVERGFRAIKVKIGAGVERDVATMRAIRRVVGDEIALMMDANGAYQAAGAIELASRVQDLNITWFEEPVVPDDLDGYRRIRSATSIPLAAGEGGFTRFGARHFIVPGLVDIYQPDVARSGGISETLKIIHLAAAHHVAYAPHVGWSGAVCVAATLQLAAVAMNFRIYECMFNENPIREHLARTSIGGPDQLKDGQIPIPTGPGLGVELDPEALQRYRIAAS